MQFRDLKTQYQALKPQIDSAIQSVLDCSEFILGSPVAELEEKLADYVGCSIVSLVRMGQMRCSYH